MAPTVSVDLLDLHQLLVAPGADDLDERLLVRPQALLEARRQALLSRSLSPQKSHLHGGFELRGVVLSRALHQTQDQGLQGARQRRLQGRAQVLKV